MDYKCQICGELLNTGGICPAEWKHRKLSLGSRESMVIDGDGVRHLESYPMNVSDLKSILGMIPDETRLLSYFNGKYNKIKVSFKMIEKSPPTLGFVIEEQ